MALRRQLVSSIHLDPLNVVDWIGCVYLWLVKKSRRGTDSDVAALFLQWNGSSSDKQAIQLPMTSGRRLLTLANERLISGMISAVGEVTACSMAAQQGLTGLLGSNPTGMQWRKSRWATTGVGCRTGTNR